jgi:hypothetical protein
VTHWAQSLSWIVFQPVKDDLHNEKYSRDSSNTNVAVPSPIQHVAKAVESIVAFDVRNTQIGDTSTIVAVFPTIQQPPHPL